MPVVLNDREEGVNGIVDLAAGSGSDLVVCQGVMFFCILGNAGNQEAFVKFGDSTTEVDASIGGRVQSVFFLSFRVLAFMDGLEETFLPGLRVGIIHPEGVEKI
jgi:hypothetical protein